MPKGPEALVQKAITDWLTAKGIFHLRMNSGAVVSQYKGKTRMIRYGTEGCADILAFVPAFIEQDGVKTIISMPIWIEVKAKKGVQSESQKAWEAKVESEGQIYILARSIEDVETVIGG